MECQQFCLIGLREGKSHERNGEHFYGNSRNTPWIPQNLFRNASGLGSKPSADSSIITVFTPKWGQRSPGCSCLFRNFVPPLLMSNAQNRFLGKISATRHSKALVSALLFWVISKDQGTAADVPYTWLLLINSDRSAQQDIITNNTDRWFCTANCWILSSKQNWPGTRCRVEPGAWKNYVAGCWLSSLTSPLLQSKNYQKSWQE